jgi:hypothetical protein
MNNTDFQNSKIPKITIPHPRSVAHSVTDVDRILEALGPAVVIDYQSATRLLFLSDNPGLVSMPLMVF